MSKPQAWAAGSVEPPAKERPSFKAERRLPAVNMYKLRGVGKGDVAFLALIAVLTAIYFYYVFTHCECKPPVVNFHTARSADDTQLVDKLMKKLEAVKYLNEKRAEANAPPLQLIELNVAKWRAEYIARTGHFSSFDLEGRNPNYWYTRLDGGMYGAKEVLAWIKHLNNTSRRYGFRDGIARAFSGYWGHMLNPCYNYIAMETAYAYESVGIVLYRIEYYVFWLIAKWIDWTSLPLIQ